MTEGMGGTQYCVHLTVTIKPNSGPLWTQRGPQQHDNVPPVHQCPPTGGHSAEGYRVLNKRVVKIPPMEHQLILAPGYSYG